MSRAAIPALLLAVLLAACSDPAPVDPGLIVNPRFEPSDTGTRPANWGFSQHAGERSYEIAAEDGILVIRKIGEEPWGLVNQKVDASELAGKRLAFSMELAGDLKEPSAGALQRPGLVVRVRGRGPADVPLLGPRHLLGISQEPGLAAGTHDWTRHALQFEMPEGRDLELTVGVQMTMDGELRARAPQLLVLDATATSQ